MTFEQALFAARELDATHELVTKRFALVGADVGRLYRGKLRIIAVLGKPHGRGSRYNMWCAVKPVVTVYSQGAEPLGYRQQAKCQQ